EESGKIVFLRKIVPGGADRSYGVHVAQLAGIPRPVIHRAEEILEELEKKGDARARRKAMKDMTMPVAWQMTLLASDQHPLVEELKTIAIDELSPIEAINKLYELQRKAKRGSYDFGREPDKPIALAGLHRPRRHLRARSHHRGQCPPAPILRPAHRPPR